MTLAAPSAPSHGFRALRRSLASRAGRVTQLDPGYGRLEVGPPLPLYRIRRSEALSPRPLRSARLVSWEYPLFGGVGPVIASMREEPGGGIEFGGILYGTLPSRTVEAASVAERELGARKRAYRATLVDCPGFRLLLFVARASHGPSLVIPLVEGKPEDEGADLAVSWGLRPFLARRAAAIRSDSEAAKRLRRQVAVFD